MPRAYLAIPLNPKVRLPDTYLQLHIAVCSLLLTKTANDVTLDCHPTRCYNPLILSVLYMYPRVTAMRSRTSMLSRAFNHYRQQKRHFDKSESNVEAGSFTFSHCPGKHKLSSFWPPNQWYISIISYNIRGKCKEVYFPSRKVAGQSFPEYKERADKI